MEILENTYNVHKYEMMSGEIKAVLKKQNYFKMF